MDSPFFAMLAEMLPPAIAPTSAAALDMLQQIPPALWNGFSLAATPEGKAAALEIIRAWIYHFGLALL